MTDITRYIIISAFSLTPVRLPFTVEFSHFKITVQPMPVVMRIKRGFLKSVCTDTALSVEPSRSESSQILYTQNDQTSSIAMNANRF